MVETVATVVLEIAKCFVSPLGHHFGYLRSHNRNFDHLSEGARKLKFALGDVQRKVEDAIKNVEEIKSEVKEWQNKVDSIIDEAEKLIEEKGSNRCFKGLCPDLKTRYKHSKEASKKMEAIARLLQEEEKFNTVSNPVVHEDIRLLSTKDFEAFESRNTVLKNIMDSLNDAAIHMVGVYGMGGIGKTTLVKEVARQAKKDKLFDEVVFVEISEKPNIKQIQEEIAGRLDLRLDDQPTESQRADKLYARLMKNEKILLILDNIWTVDLDLETIGIPSQANHGRCKFLLTSRILDVLEHIGSKSFRIDVLKEEEDWNLFKKIAGGYIEDPEFKSVAIDVVKECGGLPVAIVTVAKALRSNKKLFEWKDALRELRKPAPENFTGVLKKAYSKIEFSYNKLEDDKLKETFLLCGLMKNNASISDLVKYVIGLNILGRDIPMMEEARNRVKKLVRQLKDSCLLLDGGDSTSRNYFRDDNDPHEHFSMHDVVRDVAISIASRDQQAFTERNDDFRDWPGKDELKKCMKISLHGHNIGEPPELLECPELEFFYMRAKSSSFKIPENIFKGMAKLGVLHFDEMQLLSLPSSLCHLVNLQTLCLDFGKFKDDVVVIGELKQLKILSMKGSNITQLPKEIGQLSQLRSLDLSNCSKLKVIATNVISSLSRLEELFVRGCSVQWEVEGSNVERSNARLNELKDLPHLTTLEVEIKDDNSLPKDLFSKELQRYIISIGDFGHSSWSSKHFKTSRVLKLKLVSNVCLKELQGFKNVESLYLDELKGVKNILYELDEEGFPKLKHLHIQNNQYFHQFIFDSRDSILHDSFPMLESISLEYLINLEKLCHCQLAKMSFCNLKIINVSNCCKLEYIFSFSHVKCLPKLEEINVSDCRSMKEIFVVRGEANGNNNTEVIDKFELCQLRKLLLNSLPQLASFYSTPAASKKRRKELTTESQSSRSILEDGLNNPASLFNQKVAFPNLDALTLDNINSEIIWDRRQLPTRSCCYQNLTSLDLSNCQRLKYAFPSFIVRSLEQLQRLTISKCRVLEMIVAKVGEVEAAVTVVFRRLTYLRLSDLPQLETFYPELHTSEWPMLKRLEVGYCDNIKVLSSDDKKNGVNISRPHSLFLTEKINPKLEELKLCGKSIMTMCEVQLPENYFSKFKVLWLEDDESTSVPFGILQTCNMEMLTLYSCWYKDILSCEEDEKYVGMLTQLQVFDLRFLYDLKYILQHDSKVKSVFQNLKILRVYSCYKLIKLVPSSASFQNLTTLEVGYCDGLMNIVTSSTAKSMRQLREMKIQRCQMMIEIVASEGDEEKEEIVFSKLKLLSFLDLKSLKWFCSGNYAIEFPRLEELKVEGCPNMKTFCGGVISTPRLRKVEYRSGHHGECGEVDHLNTTIQQLYRRVLYSNLEELTLSGDDIRMILEDPFPGQYSRPIKVLKVIEDESLNIPFKFLHRFNNLTKLIVKLTSYKELFSYEEAAKQDEMLTEIKSLELWGLSNLMYMWQPDSQLESILPNLQNLEVCYCHNLIILLPSLASFRNLTTLKVSFCDGLRNLLASSTAKSLVLLESLTIEHCEMMVEVLENEEDAAKNEIVFSKLKDLELKNLESLTSFCSANVTLKFPSLDELYVIKCPMMKTFSEGVLSTPRLQKVRQWDWGKHEECWEGDLNTTIQKVCKKVNA